MSEASLFGLPVSTCEYISICDLRLGRSKRKTRACPTGNRWCWGTGQRQQATHELKI